MCPGFQLSRADREQLEDHGIDLAEARRQLNLIETPPAPPTLVRACRSDDGIAQLPESEAPELEAAWRRYAERNRPAKFVPASGAATRMFAAGASVGERLGDPSRSELAVAARNGDDDARLILSLAEQVDRLPFVAALEAAAGAAATSLARLKERPLRLATFLSDSGGLDLASLPKGLIPFHRYDREARTAFEEHLHEAAGYVMGERRVAVLHFTVSDDHRPSFEEARPAATDAATAATGARFEVAFSTQAASTDTLSLDSDGAPLRDGEGRLILRPSGHGALIHNLGRLDADVVFIKNIDNIAPADRHEETARWKRRLAGHLLRLRAEAFELIKPLERSETDSVAAAVDFCHRRLTLRMPPGFGDRSADVQRQILIDRLDRPLRVAGVVRNEGEPGGGPYWVSDPSRGESGQIVETSQIDMESEEQRSIVKSSSHFNPVDLVCSLRDRRGEAYDLDRFIDSSASFVTEKRHRGRPIRTLERPGLWNGAMAGWNTAFVEVPLSTFNPVKTVADLLRPGHQPAG